MGDLAPAVVKVLGFLGPTEAKVSAAAVGLEWPVRGAAHCKTCSYLAAKWAMVVVAGAVHCADEMQLLVLLVLVAVVFRRAAAVVEWFGGLGRVLNLWDVPYGGAFIGINYVDVYHGRKVLS